MIDVKEEQIKLLCKQLKLPTFANYTNILRQSQPGADFGDLLLDLLMAETSARQENQNRRRLKAAGFPFQKTLDEFDFSWLNPSISPVFIHELASCKFIDDRKNIVMIGNPGRGKTHISIAIGLKACLQGYRVLFKNAGTLATELTEARDAYQLGRIERQLEKTDLLILDEPASGLDPRTRVEYTAILKELRDQGKTLLVSSHILSELSELCTSIGIIEQGRTVLQGSMDQIFARINSSNPLLISIFSQKEKALAILKSHPCVQTIAVQGDEIKLGFLGDRQDEALLLQQLIDADVMVSSFMREKGSLESLFMQITGHEEERAVLKHEMESGI